MLNSLPKPAALLTRTFTCKPMNKNRANRFLLGAVLVLLMLGMPHGAHAQWVRYGSYSLWEEGDPAFARKGTYDLYYNKTQPGLYGFPWIADTRIGGYCNSSGVAEYGGDTNGWMVGYTTDVSFLSTYDFRANRAWSVYYNKAAGDGSIGTDYDCRPGGGPFNVYGYHYFFARAPQWQTHFTYQGHDNVVIGDLLLCGTGLLVHNCNWYYIYQ
jgi:hypothetical protein